MALERRHVVRALELFTPAAAEPAGRSDDDAGPVIRVVMPRVVDAEAGVQIELAASNGGTNVLFVSAEGDPAAGDIVGQCREVYARIGTLLAAAGAGLDAVVKTTEFVTPAGLADYRKTADVRREMFAPPYPAATGVVCEAADRARRRSRCRGDGCDGAPMSIADHRRAQELDRARGDLHGARGTGPRGLPLFRARARRRQSVLSRRRARQGQPSRRRSSRRRRWSARPTRYSSMPPDENGYIGHQLGRCRCPAAVSSVAATSTSSISRCGPTTASSVTWRIVDIYERDTRKNGALIFVVSEARYTNQRGELLAVNRETNIHSAMTGSRIRWFEDVAVGETLPPLEIDHHAHARSSCMRAATWDFHRYHYDSEFVATLGMPAPFMDGQMIGALLARQLMQWGGATPSCAS